jgi:integrase/recombinase XerD
MRSMQLTPNAENMRLYNRYLKGLGRQSEKTKKKVMQYLIYLEEHLAGKPIKKITPNDVTDFQDSLDNRTYNSKPIAGSTKFGAVNTIGKFFSWLSHITGYKTVITYEITNYFKLSRQEKKAVRGEKKIKRYPTLEEVKDITEKIPTDNILGRRIRALICYLFLTGARIEATSTMQLGLVDLNNRIVFQHPEKNVRTKYGKKIETTIPYVDESLFEILKGYCEELIGLGFCKDDPLFPKAESEKQEGELAFKVSSTLAREFMSEKSMSKLVKVACLKAGYGQYHCHSFRDSHLSYMLSMAKTPQELKAVSLNVGHENVSTTIEEYADISTEAVHYAILAMSKPTENDFNSLPNEAKKLAIDLIKVARPDIHKKYFGNNPAGGNSEEK